MAFQPGEVIDGRYTILEELGRGGMATVFRASQPAVNRMVAIKVLPSHLAGDPNFYERFDREARLIASLEHPHILPVHDFGRHGGQAYLVMRYIEGGTLFDELRGAPLRPDRTLHLLTQIADALDAAHRRGVVHRDIKPSNILLDRAGNAYVGDFGIAKALETRTGLTGSGIIGTPEYMAPEQAQGHPVDARCDVYSLGIVLFQMVTGRLPFAANHGSALSLAYKHIVELPPAPSSINPGLSPDFDGVILKALSKDPALRYPTAGALAQAFRAVIQASDAQRAGPSIRLAPQPIPAPTVEQPRPAPSLADRLVSVSLAGGVAGGAMFLAGLLITLAGAFTGSNAAGGATVTVQDIGTPLVSAVVVGLAAAGLRLLRVFLSRSGCLMAGLHGGFGLAIGAAAGFAGYVVFLIVTPGDRSGAGLAGVAGSLLAVFNLFGLSAMGAGLGAGLAGPVSRGRPLWQNFVAVVLPLFFGAAGTALATLAAFTESPFLADFVLLAAFFLAQPALLTLGLIIADWTWGHAPA